MVSVFLVGENMQADVKFHNFSLFKKDAICEILWTNRDCKLVEACNIFLCCGQYSVPCPLTDTLQYCIALPQYR